MSFVGKIKNTLIEEFPTEFNEIIKNGELFSKLNSREPEQRIFPLPEGDAVNYYGWGDGSGNSLHLWVHPATKTAMLTLYDHESVFNYYSETDKTKAWNNQLAIYEGVPELFLNVVKNRDETYELFNISNPDSIETIYYATGVLFFNGEFWKASEGYQEALQNETNEDGGFNYLTGLFTLQEYESIKGDFIRPDEEPADYIIKAFEDYEKA